MPRTKKPTQEQQNTGDETELVTQPPEDEFTPQDVEVMELLEDIGGDDGTKVRIYRQGTTYTDLTLIHECAPSEFTPMMLAHPPYNGGSFRIHVRSKTGFVGNKPLKVAPASDAITPGVTTAAPIAQQPQGMQASDMLTMLDKIMESNRVNMENLMLRMKPTETDPLKTLEGIKQIAELVKPASAPVDSFQQTMKGVELFMGMQERIKGPAAPITDDGELSLPAMFMLFMKQMGEMKKAAPTPVENPNPALPAPTQSTADEIKMQEDMDEMNILLKWQLKQANAAAKAGADPAEYAETIYPILPDPIFDFLTNDPKWFESVTAQVPECKQYEAWYMKVRESLIAFALEDSKENTAAPLTPETKSPTVVGITQSGENIVGNNSGTNPNG